MGELKQRDLNRFFGLTVAGLIIHSLLFRLDGDDVTQIMIAVGVYTIVAAIRERQP